MNERDALPADVHPETALLPWYVNGTLGQDDRLQVERHLGSCPDCRNEVDELRRMKRELSALYRQEPAPSPGLAQTVLQRVRQSASAFPVSQPSSAGWLDGIDSWLRSLFQPQWVPTLAALALAVQFGLLLWVTSPPGPPQEVLTRGVGQPAASFRVLFHEQATESQIRALLTSLHGRIVDGPDGEQAYVVQVMARTPDLVSQALDTLNRRTEIVRRAELFRP